MTSSEADDGRLLAGRYRLVTPLGRGGMGTVWRATDELLDRDVAVKELRLPPEVSAAERSVLKERTKREARAAARLSHPGVVTVLDVVDAEDRPWIVMELVPSRSLAQVVEEDGPLPYRRVAEIGLRLLAALGVAHSAGVIHRDVKPGNVLLGDNGRVVLTDFGLAVLEGDPSLTQSGMIIGSPAYMAPERARGGVVSPASDLWSLGATLYTAVEGRPPYDRKGSMAVLTAALFDDPDPSEFAGPLRPLLEELLRRDPAARPGIGDAARRLQHILLTPEPKPAPEPEPPSDPAPTVALGPDGSTQNLGAVGTYDVRSRGDEQAATPAAGGGFAAGAGAARLGAAFRERVRRKPVAFAAAAVVLVALAVVAFALGGDGDSPPSTPAATGGPVPGTPSAGPTEGGKGENKGKKEDKPKEGVHPGYRKYEDESGFALQVPEGWRRESRGNSVFFRAPGGGYLQIDQTGSPKDDAVADWRNQEASASGRFDSYELIGIRPLDGPYVTAADWEFTFRSGGTPMHAVNRAMVTDDEHGYALFLVAPAKDWPTAEKRLEVFTSTFKPDD